MSLPLPNQRQIIKVTDILIIAWLMRRIYCFTDPWGTEMRIPRELLFCRCSLCSDMKQTNTHTNRQTNKQTNVSFLWNKYFSILYFPPLWSNKRSFIFGEINVWSKNQKDVFYHLLPTAGEPSWSGLTFVVLKARGEETWCRGSVGQQTAELARWMWSSVLCSNGTATVSHHLKCPSMGQRA